MDIDLHGPCTIAQSASLKEQLLAAMTGGKQTVLRFAGVEEVDLSFFQILHAATMSFQKQHVALVLSQDLPPRLADKARRCGFDAIIASH